MDPIYWILNQLPKTEDQNLKVMAMSEVQKAKAFHESIPEYSETPLVALDNTAGFLGLGNIFVKDESYRFGLNAFKVLGGSFAIARYIAKKTNRDVSELDYYTLTSPKLREEFGQATFYTATDGNHGRGVAWAANKLGQKSVVLMPKGSSKTRLENILKENAIATIEEVNYDECVRMANAAALKAENGVMVQDTAWDGYEEIPSWIMQGYGTMALEADEQLVRKNENPPTHVFIQAGVGSLAGGVVGYFVNRYPKNPPTFIVVEATVADCLYRSIKANDGNIHIADGDMQTIMAGLACGEPNTISWDILRNHVSVFASLPDWVAARGMRILSAPIKGDSRIISGESGAAPFGLLSCIMQMDELKELKEALKLNETSNIINIHCSKVKHVYFYD
ncbi:MAG: diaminopropionate ammonia-lyase [Anaerocolumna sp.]|nr:diaminopropionate ammonia-lyase [Anaerocolumna sp.]